MTRNSPLQLALVLLASLLLAAGVFIQIPLETDMAGFLPIGHDTGTRFLMREVRDGVASSFITIAIEGEKPTELARISRGMRTILASDPQFAAVLNGAFSADQNEHLNGLLFTYRYLLSPSPQTRDFSVPALSRAFDTTLDALQSAAEPIIRNYALSDPTGALADSSSRLQPQIRASLIEGVWFARDRPPQDPRALILIRTKASGMNLAAQKKAPGTIQAAFARTHPGSARLIMSGPAVLAAQSASVMRSDIHLVTLASISVVAGILFWRFRSLWVLAAIGAPFLISTSIAMLMVRLCFGSVHGIAFGFGMTMLGVSLDYPVLLIGHRDSGEGPQATLRRIGQSLKLAAVTASLGLSGMIMCGLPGLAQLGVFAATGLVASAVVTLLIMPRLIVSADLAPFKSGRSTLLEKIEGLRRGRVLCGVPIAAAGYLLLLHPPRLITDLTALSPVMPAAKALELELRRELGTPDSSRLIAVHAENPERLLEREESLHPVFAKLAQAGRVSGIQDAAQILPSAAMQHMRQASLPDNSVLSAAIDTALENLPFRHGSFDRFAHDVDVSRRLMPLTPSLLSDTPLAEALSPLMFERGDGWWGLVLLRDARDMPAIRAALSGEPNILVMDLNEKLRDLTAYHTRETLRWSAAGVALAIFVLLLVLRDTIRLLKVVVSVGAVMIILPAILVLRHEPLSLVHIVAIQFVTGVALDYALFFARPQLDSIERARTARTLITCNIMTVLTFACLGLCQTPLLSEIGITISLGAALSLLFSFVLAGERHTLATPASR